MVDEDRSLKEGCFFAEKRVFGVKYAYEVTKKIFSFVLKTLKFSSKWNIICKFAVQLAAFVALNQCVISIDNRFKI